MNNCKFDYCVAQKNTTVCSPLERLADHCKKMGFCFTWRNLTNGICGKAVLLVWLASRDSEYVCIP